MVRSCLADKHMFNRKKNTCLIEKKTFLLSFIHYDDNLKGTQGQSFTSVFYIFLLTLWAKSLLKSFLAYFTKL